jgi:arylformamidase
VALEKERRKSMKIHDVSLTIHPGMVVWPSDPPVTLERKSKIEEGANANVSRLDLGVHTGTHVDAPYHFLPSGSRVDALDLDMLIGPVYLAELPESAGVVDAAAIRSAGIPDGVTRLLFKTRNSALWARDERQFQTGFAGITKDGAEALVSMGVQLVGIDYLSIAPYKQSRPTHEVLLGAKMVIIEGLDLSSVGAGW